jgi:hypothetical protein
VHDHADVAHAQVAHLAALADVQPIQVQPERGRHQHGGSVGEQEHDR